MSSSEERSIDYLINRARDGNRSAMNYLMATMRSGLMRRIKTRYRPSLAHNLDHSDLVQETQMQAVTDFDKFEGRSPAEFRGWMGAILDHVALQRLRYWRQKKRDRTSELTLDHVPCLQDTLARSNSILTQLGQREEYEHLMIAMGWCPLEDQKVIEWHLFDGRSHVEIAAELGLSAEAVRKRFSRAISRLREAKRFQLLMRQHGIAGQRQEVIGLHRFQDLSATIIAARLQLPASVVSRWVEEAAPLIRAFDEGAS